jgi:hypothetical protein
MIPFPPLFVGAIFAAFDLRARAWIVSLAAVAAAAIAGDLYHYQTRPDHRRRSRSMPRLRRR